MTLTLHPADTELPDSLLQASHKETGERQRETERELFPKLLNSATKQTAIRVASSQLSGHPQPLVSAVWSSHPHPRASGRRGLLSAPCASRSAPSLGTLNSPLVRCKECINIFQKCINSHRFQMYHSSKWMKMLTLLKNVFVYCVDLLHQVFVGARGIFAAFLWDLVSRHANSRCGSAAP